MDRRTLAIFLTLAIIWGSSFAMIKVAVGAFTPTQLVFLRLILGAASLTLIMRWRKVRLRIPGRTWMHLFILSVFANVLPYTLLSKGEQATSAGIAGVIVAATPLMTLLLATKVFARTHLGATRLTGFLIGFVGVVIALEPWNSAAGSLTARLLCFGAAASYAVGFSYTGRFIHREGLDPLALATNQLIAAAILSVPSALIGGWNTARPGTHQVLALLMLGVVSTGLANIAFFHLTRLGGGATASAVNYVVPLFAVLFGALLLGERIHWTLLAGALVVLTGMAVADGRLVRVVRGYQ